MKPRTGGSLLTAVILAWSCGSPATPDLSGRWVYEENVESAELLLEHDTATGRVRGTFVALGKSAPISGRADASSLLIDSVGDAASSPENGTMVAAISGDRMVLTIAQPGQDPVILPLTRRSVPAVGSAGSESASTAGTGAGKSASRAPATGEERFTPSEPEAFAGSWEAVSDDGTNTETAELHLADGILTGTIRSLERGYYSGRVTVTAEVAVRGTPGAGGLDLRAWNVESGSPERAVSGRAMRRGDFLILRIGDGETGYARPGVPVVQSAEGSTAAAALARAVAGRIYSASTQASGRGAFVGNRVRLALCADGSIAFDVSDLASTGGTDAVDIGDATSRRGGWSVVLLAGSPVVRAHWSGTGSSYSLTTYFRVQPHQDGSGARIDGTDLPATGSC